MFLCNQWLAGVLRKRPTLPAAPDAFRQRPFGRQAVGLHGACATKTPGTRPQVPGRAGAKPVGLIPHKGFMRGATTTRLCAAQVALLRGASE